MAGRCERRVQIFSRGGSMASSWDEKNDSDMQRYFYELVGVVTKAKASRHTEKLYYYYLTLCIQGGSDKSGIFQIFFFNVTAQLNIIQFL
jgi:hypothetical protein